jgi:hypothetical protein
MVGGGIWGTLMADWLWERGPVTATFTGATEPHNSDIQADPGFKKLLKCWIAQNLNGVQAPPSSNWNISSDGFSYHESHDPRKMQGASQVIVLS